MATRLTGAGVRAFLVMVLVVTPSVLLPGTGDDAKEMVALIALAAGVLTFVEYNADYPGLIEFRDAPPFNRLRFLMLFATVFVVSVVAAGPSLTSPLALVAREVGQLIGTAMDFPYSPVRLAALMAGAPGTDAYALALSAAGIGYLIALLSLAFFLIALRFHGWPARGAFNVWINLPTFDPTAGGDVVDRLDRDARVNIVLGFLLPFLIPAVVRLGLGTYLPLSLDGPQSLVWVMASWSFLPASLFMRGIAMGRVAQMIRTTRRLNGVAPVPGVSA